MNQSKFESIVETVASTVTGYLVALLIQWWVFPIFGINISMSTNMVLTAIFTLASIIRGYLFRRAFNWYSMNKRRRDLPYEY